MFKAYLQKIWLNMVATLLIGAYSLFPVAAVFAEGETPPADTPAAVEVTQPPVVVEPPPADPIPVVNIEPPAVTPGPQTPQGPDANTYIYNGTTGLWENALYEWDPATNQTKPKTSSDYSYNPQTGKWDTTEWAYNPASGTYQENRVSTPNPPLGEETEQLIDSLPELQGSLLRALLAPSLFGLGPSSANSFTNNSSNTGFFDLFHNASISNTIQSTAVTGDASVTGNTVGGSAKSGNAKAIANLFNVLNSSLGFLNSNPAMFMANILGNVLGDLLIDPGQLPANTNANTLTNNDITVKEQNYGTINNDIQLIAASGAATVATNTQAGSATTGDAYAMANVVNAINSAIGSGQSFMGMINIYGNFNGDILLPPGFINSLLASNAQAPQTGVEVITAPNSNNQLTNSTSTTANLTVTDTSTTLNNIAVSAGSGNATVANNTNAGSATTGSATTNVTLLNLTGKQIIGKNALLVFVNVLGSWVGLIMNAPNGTTAGALGGGVTTNQTTAENNTLNATSTTNNQITNNITASAATGDALVANNTTAGNATSGNAGAAVNVLNITNSSFSLTDWFGILFINVLGNWNGSFGINTDAGNAVVIPNSAAPSTTNAPRVFGYAPNNTTLATNGGGAAGYTQAQGAETVAAPTGNTSEPTITAKLGTNTSNARIPWQIIIAAALLAAVLVIEELLKSKTQKQQVKIA